MRDLVYFPVLFNLVAFGLIGVSYVLAPDLYADYSQMMFIMYVSVSITEWVLAYIVWRKFDALGISMSEIIAPKKPIRWGPAIGVFLSLNALFITYIGLSMWVGYVAPFEGLNNLQVLFLVVLAPVTAGLVEEIAFRGYLIEKMLKNGLDERRAIVYSAFSFAFIHGFFVIDKLLVTFVFGLVAGLYYVRERNLLVLIFSHIVVDVVTFSMTIIGLF